MQMIKELNDIPKIANLLNEHYKTKLISDINNLLIKYINEQNINSDSGQNVPNNNTENNEKPFAFGTLNKAQAAPTNQDNLNALKSSFGKPSGNAPPPPPPMPTTQMPITRSIATGGAFQLKSNTPIPSPNNSKKPLYLIDALGYITPILTDIGITKAKDISTPTDIFQLMKSMDGKSSLKEIYQLLFNNNSNSLGKYLEKIYIFSREKYANLNKNTPIPDEYEFQLRLGDMMVLFGWITNDSLENALKAQKDGSTIKVESNSSVPSWMEKAASTLQQNNNLPKKKLGDVMIDLNIITSSQLESALTLQKWLKNIILLTK